MISFAIKSFSPIQFLRPESPFSETGKIEPKTLVSSRLKIKILVAFVLTILSSSLFVAQTTAYAYVKDEHGNAVERAEVDLSQSSNDMVADKIGYFQFVNLEPGNYQINISKAGLETRRVKFTIEQGERRKDLGVISLRTANHSTDLGILVLDDAIADSDGSLVQPMTNLLSARRDVYQKNATLEQGMYNFVPRGIDNRFEEISFNGISLSDPIDGIVDPIQWGGLSDITRHPSEISDYLSFSKYAFANLAGSLYYDTKASNFSKETSITYSYLNRNYKNRLMASYASGLLKNGWAFAFSASKRSGDDGVIQGIEQDNYAYFASIEKKFSDRSSVNLTTFGAPTKRDTYSANTAEVYELMGKNYNAYWGFDQGKNRSARTRNSFMPVVQLQFYNVVGEASNWNNTISYQFGRDAQSRLSWRNAPNPYPTYYTNMPSFWRSQNATESQLDGLIERWHQDESFNQINWEGLRESNQNHSAQGANYMVVEDIRNSHSFNFASHFDTKITEFWNLNLNLNYQNFNSQHYQEVNDLLGAEFALNQYAFGENLNYDLSSDSRIVAGDRYKYDYQFLRNEAKFNASTDADLNNWNVMASFFLSYSSSQRKGNYQNPYYANSKGQSALISNIDAGVKARISYKFNPRSQVSYSALLYSVAPTLSDLFVNPQLSNLETPNIQNKVVSSNELRYIYNSHALRIRVSGFWSDIKNATEVSRFYTDLYSQGNMTNTESYVTEILSGIEKRYKGLELGIEARVHPNVKLFAISSLGEYTIENNPNVLLTTENETSAQGYQDLGPANIKDYKLAGSPQTAATLGFRYSNKKLWWLGGSANFFSDHYMDFYAANRTAEFYTNPQTNTHYDKSTDLKGGLLIPTAPPTPLSPHLPQVKMDDQWLFNLDAGKSFSIGRYTLGLSISVINVLDNRDYISGGYEQIRNTNYREAQSDAERTEPLFGTKFWHDRGRTFFTNVTFKF